MPESKKAALDASASDGASSVRTAELADPFDTPEDRKLLRKLDKQYDSCHNCPRSCLDSFAASCRS